MDLAKWVQSSVAQQAPGAILVKEEPEVLQPVLLMDRYRLTL